MNRLLGKVVCGVLACVSLGACAKPDGASFGFATGLPDASMTPLSNDDAALGAGDSPIVTSPPPIFDGSIVISFADDAGGTGSADGGAPISLVFVPPTATVTIDGTGPQTASFSLQADFGTGPVMVTAEAVEFDRPDLATVTATEPVVATAPAVPSTTPYAGTGVVHAIYHGVEAKASLTVQVHLTQYSAGLSATSPGVAALGAANLGADPAPAISPILYPYDKTVWPLGLTSPLMMWNGVGATDVYRLHYAENAYAVDYYTTAAPPAQARLDQTTWDRLTNSNGSFYGTADPITFTLSRWDSATQMAYTSATETWTVAPESLRGAIYYWSASRGATGGRISQFRPGPGATPQVLNTPGGCAGCHAVNAQGTVLVADINDNAFPSVAPYDNWSGTRPWASFDITQATDPLILQTNMFGGDPALTPDGRYLVFGGPANPPTTPGSKYISLGDPRTGMVIPTSGLDSVTPDPGETNLEMPAFSPDGTKLVLVEGALTTDRPRDNVIPFGAETIAYLNFTESGPTFDPTLHKITSAADPAFAAAPGLAYPSFTPDSTAVAFHAGTKATGCNTSCDDNEVDDGNLYVATLANGTPIRLAAACDPPDMTDRNSSIEPTFNPVVRGGYSWAVFTTMRKWGNQPWPATQATLANCATGACNAKRRLWLTAVDTKIGTTDPSHPAIYLEGQDNTPNMRAFYTLTACIPSPGANVPADAGAGGPTPGSTCSNGFECCSGFCQTSTAADGGSTGVCIEPTQLSCVGLGGPCTESGDCCNSPPVQCIGNICKVPITH
jgi:WD40 repeat protein